TLSTASEGGGWEPIQALEGVALAGTTLELAVPFGALGELQTGDRLTFVAVASQQGRDLDIAPSVGPARVVVPELQPVTALLTVQDPEGDDYGPGSYTYPTDPLFDPGAFDLKQFVVGADEQNLVFAFSFVGPVNNPWGSGSGLSVQTLDVYIDTDHQAGSGRRLLLPGRNAALPDEEAWNYVVWVEGWTPGVYRVDEAGEPKQVSTEMRVTVDPVAQTVTIRVPLSAFPGDDPAAWSYLGAVLGQEGFPAKGVWRVRDVEEEAAQYRFGGGPANTTNHTRVIDLAWPADATPSQEEMLGDYPPSQEPDMDKLGPDDFAQVRMLRP
ncbi:MAG: glucodextranase DOMON-like domain-containing protein, partial [Anaerolineae bacterium]